MLHLPMRGMGSGVFEIALPFRGNAFRVVYAVQLAAEIWVVHALRSIRVRLKSLKEILR
jgi:phage-related protein